MSTAPPAFVQARAGEANAGTSTSVAFTSNNAAGNLIVAYVIWNNTGTVSLSDTRGNTYASAGARRAWGTNARWSSQVFYAKNIAGGANTVNATFATALNGGWGTVYVHEYSGVDRVNAFDAESAATGTARAMSSGAVTTSSASLLFSAGASSHRVTAAGPELHDAIDRLRQPHDGPDLVRRRHVHRDDDSGPEPVGAALGGLQVCSLARTGELTRRRRSGGDASTRGAGYPSADAPPPAGPPR